MRWTYFGKPVCQARTVYPARRSRTRRGVLYSASTVKMSLNLFCDSRDVGKGRCVLSRDFAWLLRVWKSQFSLASHSRSKCTGGHFCVWWATGVAPESARMHDD